MAVASLPDGPGYREVPDCPGYVAGTDGSLWKCWTGGRWPKRVPHWTRVAGTPTTSDGHLRVLLRTAGGFRVTDFLHRVVLTTFVGPCPPGMIACHDPDPNPANNAVDNLRWATPTANTDDCKRHGRFARGDRMPQAKLRDEDIPEVFRLREAGESHQTIATRFGIPRTLVTKVLLRLRYKHIPVSQSSPFPKRSGGKYARGEQHRAARLTATAVAEIRRLRSEGWTQKRLAAQFGVSASSVGDILNGRTWSHVTAPPA